MERIREELRVLEEKGQYRKIPDITNKIADKIIINGSEYLNFASNDYLSISTNKSLQQEFLKLSKSSLSSASARLLSGSSSEFTELENNLAKLFDKEKCLIFNTGYQCNLGIISTLCQKGDVVFSDKLNHASIIDGMRLSEGDFYRFKHLDYNSLENLLKTHRDKYKRAIIVSESIFSMDGDIANIDKLVELKNKYNCLLMIDEAHAFCAYGTSLTGVSYRKDVDIVTATMGKALGAFGAFCVANEPTINYFINKARSFIFSTSIPPINIAWANWLITEKKECLISQKNKLNSLIDKVSKLLNSSENLTHIIPFVIGSNEKTLTIAENLRAEGYYIPAIRPPTVANGQARLRLSLNADMRFEDIEKAINIINK